LNESEESCPNGFVRVDLLGRPGLDAEESTRPRMTECEILQQEDEVVGAPVDEDSLSSYFFQGGRIPLVDLRQVQEPSPGREWVQ